MRARRLEDNWVRGLEGRGFPARGHRLILAWVFLRNVSEYKRATPLIASESTTGLPARTGMINIRNSMDLRTWSRAGANGV
jgi:hypothetical protein